MSRKLSHPFVDAPILAVHPKTGFTGMTALCPAAEHLKHQVVHFVKRAGSVLRAVIVGPSARHRIEVGDEGFLWFRSVRVHDALDGPEMPFDAVVTGSGESGKAQSLSLDVSARVGFTSFKLTNGNSQKVESHAAFIGFQAVCDSGFAGF